ncbi:MAG: septal ring lytic transglycosylase RlpA family protein [Burkholderiales bacterium]|nr:septal ring lytic transglycosylase RlpA family protein [Burkholderiales bacterium]
MKQTDRPLLPGARPTSRRPPRGRTEGLLLWTAVCATVLLAACGTTPKGSSGSGSRGGGYYKDDGPPSNPPANLDLVPDPLPAVEPLASGANKPYVIFGKRYVPDTSMQPYKVRGTASWYGRKFHGARTSNGEIYDMYAMTAAHTTLPIPSYARVTRVGTGKSVIVRVNDRGPFHSDRIIDLSYTAAYKLGLLSQGSGEVEVEWLGPEEIARIRSERGNAPMLAAAPAPVAEAEVVAIPVATQAPASQVRELPPLASASASPAPMAGGVQVPLTATTPVVSTPQSGIFLQVGAFSGQRNAEDLAARIRTQLGDQTEPLRIVNTDSLHRVHLGPYPSRESALAAAQRVQARLDIAPVIVVR